MILWNMFILSYIITIVIKCESLLAQMIMYSNVFSPWMIRYISLIIFTLKPIKISLVQSLIKSNYYKTFITSLNSIHILKVINDKRIWNDNFFLHKKWACAYSYNFPLVQILPIYDERLFE